MTKPKRNRKDGLVEHQFDFGFGARVVIDGDDSIRAIVTAIQLLPDHRERYCVSWWHDGSLREEWVDGWRLKPTQE